MEKTKFALVRVNYSQLYKVYSRNKGFDKRDIFIPYQLISLASELRDNETEIKIFDGEIFLLSENQLLRDILKWKPHFVGFTSTTPDINIVLKICKKIKKNNPDIKIIIGGSHATALASEISKESCVDYVIKGDGESPISMIKKFHINRNFKNWSGDKYYQRNIMKLESKDKSNINKILQGELKNLKFIKMPSHDLINYSYYRLTDPFRGQLKSASIFTSRGCPFNCNFCFHNKNFRLRSLNAVLKEIDYLVKEKGIRYFSICDDTFPIIRKRTIEMLDMIVNRKFKNVYFQCWARANLIDKELVEKMKEANFVRVSIGIESGSKKILKNSSKGIKKEDCLKACRILNNYDIETRGSFVIGHPFENRKTVRETIDFSKELDLYEANFTIMTPYPGTEVYKMALRGEGIHFKDKNYINSWKDYLRWGESIIRTDDLSSKEIEELRKMSHTEFYTQKKVYDYYKKLFIKGNKSSYFYRPINFAWNRKYGRNINFWEELK
jgi:radical SAM superfamily enzyme YgiQ (UPF0313 family)